LPGATERIPTSGTIAVLGLGNPVVSDDAVGLHVVEKLKSLLEADPVPGVDVHLSTRAGFELIDILQGYERAVIVDAIESTDPTPGRVRQLDLKHFAGSVRLNSAHDINIATAFELAAKLGIPMPSEVEILAVEVGDARTLSEELTAPVAAMVEGLAREIHARLKAISGHRTELTPNKPGVDRDAPRRPFYGPW
jgi:hydrogenase maturation protease